MIYHPDLVNLYGCIVGGETMIGTFVEIQAGAIIGSSCKVSSHSFICEGVTIEGEVLAGHSVMFINNLLPQGHDRKRNAADGCGLQDGDHRVDQARLERQNPVRHQHRTRRDGRRRHHPQRSPAHRDCRRARTRPVPAGDEAPFGRVKPRGAHVTNADSCNCHSHLFRAWTDVFVAKNMSAQDPQSPGLSS
jgi:hypothetical protein